MNTFYFILYIYNLAEWNICIFLISNEQFKQIRDVKRTHTVMSIQLRSIYFFRELIFCIHCTLFSIVNSHIALTITNYTFHTSVWRAQDWIILQILKRVTYHVKLPYFIAFILSLL